MAKQKENERLYKLRQSLSTWYIAFGEIDIIKSGDYREEIRLIKNKKIRFKAFEGKRAGDLAYFGIYTGLTNQFIKVLQEEGINNFSPFPFSILESKKYPVYNFLEIKCKSIKKHKKKKGLMDLGSIYIDIDDWGGEDLFTIEDTLTILCTEKVKKLVEKNKLKNFRFVELKKVK